jgi:4-amino-4-deoxy-L-arabinose transferase-like glycosyltransferase
MSAPNPHRRTIILGLILLSIAARVTLLKGNQGRLGEDLDDYLRLAENVAEWGTLGSYDSPTAFRPPLYPLVLAPLYWLQTHLGLAWGWRLAAIAFIHLVFGAAATVLTFRVAERFGLGRWSSLAAALVAIDPLLMQYTRLPMTETMAAMLVIGAIDLLSMSEHRTDSLATFAAGGFLGLGMLCRTTMWSFAFTVVLVGCFCRGGDGRRNWKWAGTVLAVAIAVQLPWIGRNWLAFRRFVPTTTHGGYTLLLGNNDVYYDEIVLGDPWTAWSGESLNRWQREMLMRAALAGVRNRFDEDAFYYQTARRTIASRPTDFARSVGLRLLNFWRITPHATTGDSSFTGTGPPVYGRGVRIASAAFYIPELLLMLLGIFDRRVWQWPWLFLPAALLSFTLVHAVYWSDMRMRAPIMPAVAVLAAMGAMRIGDRLLAAHGKTADSESRSTAGGN